MVPGISKVGDLWIGKLFESPNIFQNIKIQMNLVWIRPNIDIYLATSSLIDSRARSARANALSIFGKIYEIAWPDPS